MAGDRVRRENVNHIHLHLIHISSILEHNRMNINPFAGIFKNSTAGIASLYYTLNFKAIRQILSDLFEDEICLNN